MWCCIKIIADWHKKNRTKRLAGTEETPIRKKYFFWIILRCAALTLNVWGNSDAHFRTELWIPDASRLIGQNVGVLQLWMFEETLLNIFIPELWTLWTKVEETLAAVCLVDGRSARSNCWELQATWPGWSSLGPGFNLYRDRDRSSRLWQALYEQFSVAPRKPLVPAAGLIAVNQQCMHDEFCLAVCLLW